MVLMRRISLAAYALVAFCGVYIIATMGHSFIFFSYGWSIGAAVAGIMLWLQLIFFTAAMGWFVYQCWRLEMD